MTALTNEQEKYLRIPLYIHTTNKSKVLSLCVLVCGRASHVYSELASAVVI